MALPKYGDVSRTKTRYIYVLLFNFRIFIYFVINKNDRKNGWVLIGFFFNSLSCGSRERTQLQISESISLYCLVVVKVTQSGQKSSKSQNFIFAS